MELSPPLNVAFPSQNEEQSKEEDSPPHLAERQHVPVKGGSCRPSYVLTGLMRRPIKLFHQANLRAGSLSELYKNLRPIGQA